MKSQLLFLSILFYSTIYSQEVWQNLPLNPNCQSVVYDIEMIDGKIYQFYNQYDGVSEFKTYIYNFNNAAGTWDFNAFMNTGVLTKLKTEKIGSKLYLVGHDGLSFKFYSTNDVALIFPTTAAPDYTIASVNDNWEFHTGKNADELYVLFTTGTANSDVHGLEYQSGTNTWASVTETSSQNLALADLQIQSKNTEVYFGVFSNVMRCTRFSKGSINPMFAYDGLTGNINSDGLNWQNAGYALVGNKNDFVSFYGTEDANNQSYEQEIVAGTNINILTASPNIVNQNINAGNLAKESSASHNFIYSTFRDDGIAVGGPNEILRVIRRDISAGGNWEVVASSPLVPQGTLIENNSLELSIDNSNRHLVASFILQANNNPELKVSNNTPDVLAVSTAANTGLCVNNVNELYSNIEIGDVDFDQITITNIISLNAQTINLQVIPNGVFNDVYKFKILGIPLGSTDQIQITYTDGFGSFVLDLDVYNATTNPTPVQFTSDPLIFCSNELQVDLSQYVSYFDQGNFKLNGEDLNNSTIDANFLNNNALTAGTIRYVVNIDGCFIIANANYSIVNPPTIVVTSTPSNCTLNTGTAAGVLTNGTSSVVEFFWSTGETNFSIANLQPGAYYAYARDDNNCKATALASINSNEINIVENIVNPSCFGASDGSISLTVNGTSNYQVIWLNGTNGTVLNNISAGNYELTLYDQGGCEISKSFEIVSPSEIQIDFTVLPEPCGQNSGGATAQVSGGDGTFSYLWNNGSLNQNITGLSQGNYSLQVTDGLSCTKTDSIFINSVDGIVISDSIINADCNIENGGININLLSLPQAGIINSTSWSNGSNSEDLFNVSSGNYTLTISSSSTQFPGFNCISQKTFSIGNVQPSRVDICVVTVDSATTTNLVVWEKGSELEISHYNIYRENEQAGNFLLIDTVQYSNLSVFNDVVASPINRSWRYRISAVNTCGTESPLSSTHKTLNLNSIEELIPGTFKIYWDEYEGINTGTYIVSRFTDQAGWVPLNPTVPFGGATVFTDIPPIGYTGLDYFVEFALEFPCEATFRSQDFDRSRSNKEKGVFNPGEGTGNSNNSLFNLNDGKIVLSISPNPFQDELILNLLGSTSALIQIIDVNGKILMNFSCAEGLHFIDTKSFNQGIYFVKASINNQVQTLKIVK